MSRSCPRVVIAAIASLVVGPLLHPQCQLGWQAMPGGIAGVSPPVVWGVNRWDPDGPGPLGEHIAVGGGFQSAGGVAVWGGALWNPASGQWTTYRAPPRFTKSSLLGDGRLVVSYHHARQLQMFRNGSWGSIGALEPWPQGEVLGMTTLSTGEIAVCGSFTHISGFEANGVAVWDGTSWSRRTTGVPGARAIAEDVNGDLIVVDASGSLRRFDGIGWGAAFTPGINGTVYDLAILPNGDFVVAGTFDTAGSTPVANIASWDGNAWQSMNGGVDAVVWALHLEPSGTVLACGNFVSAGGVSSKRLARWDGVSWWQPAPNLNHTVYEAVTLSNGDIVAGGRFNATLDVVVEGIGRWNGVAWSALGSFPGPNETVFAVEALSDGGFAVAGEFTAAGPAPARKVARLDGTTWSRLGGTIDGTVYAVLEWSPGRIVVGGDFTNVGGVRVNGVALQVRGAWTAMGAGVPNTQAFVRMPNGDLVAASPTSGAFRWDGRGWQQLAFLRGMQSLVVFNGQLISGGSSTGSVHGWNGSSWNTLGSGIGGGAVTHAFQELPNGELMAGGTYGVRIWNGSLWRVPNGGGLDAIVRDLVELPDGSVLAVGFNGVFDRWDGQQWTRIRAGAGHSFAAAYGRDGTVLAGGNFGALTHVGRLSSSCPAESIESPPGCASPNPPRVTSTLPWLGSRWSSTASGLTGRSGALAVTGHARTSQLLQTIVPQGDPGCRLLVTLDFAEFVTVQNGQADVRYDLPASTALVGRQVHHQVLPITVDGGGNLGSIAATNALTLTFGVFGG